MNPVLVNRTGAALAFTTILLSLAGVGSLAHAQTWLPDRNYTEGPGIRVGDLEVHPGIAVRGGYDDNVFRADGTAQPRQGSAILAVTPHLHLSTLGVLRKTQGEDRQEANPAQPKIAFRSGLSATYYNYFIDGGPKNLGVDSDFWVGILPKRPVNVEVSATYVRNVRPFTQRSRIDSKNDFVYDIVSPVARLNIGSRSQILTSYVSYAPRVAIYESNLFNYLNNVQHGVLAGAGWRFLPSTALVYDAQLDIQNYLKSLESTNSPVILSDNKRFRTRLGVNGALTRFLSLRVMAGYAMGSFDNKALDDFENVVGEALLTYLFRRETNGTFAVGYQRDIQASALGGWVLSDRGYATMGTLIAKVLQVNLEGGAAYLTYGRIEGRTPFAGATTPVPIGAGGRTDRNDVRLDAAAHAEYRLTNWLALTGDFMVQALLTSYKYSAQIEGLAIPDPAKFYAISAFGGVRAHY